MSAPVPPPGLSSAAAMRDLLVRWADAGWLRQIDVALAGFIADTINEPPPHPLLLLAAALASHQLGRGHVCLDLTATLSDALVSLSLPPDHAALDDGLPWPSRLLAGVSPAEWRQALHDPRLVSDGAGQTPLVLAGQRLYLRRYWAYEALVKQALQERAPQADTRPDPDRLRPWLETLFPASADDAPDWQMLACALAASQPLTIVTGGPGTGKTTTVLKLLALLLSLAEHKTPPLRIHLAAPTGKAAARLQESMASALDGIPWHALPDGTALKHRMPTEVTTLHRLLGRRLDSRQLRHHAGRRLPLDVLVVDEASMVDLDMMAALVAALPPQARLVLLGDRDQLASVEAGAVLGELCARAAEAHYWPSTRDWLARATGQALDARWQDVDGTALDQCIVMLRRSYRFDANSGIGRLAAAVNAGDVRAARAVWNEGWPDLGRLDPLEQPLAWQALLAAHGESLDALRAARPDEEADDAALDGWARDALRRLSATQLLCAVRHGPWGVDRLNAAVAAYLHASGRIPSAQGWYEGRPVLVTRNDYALGLMNGDIGVVLSRPVAGRPGRQAALRVAFAQAGVVRWVAPARLQSVDTVYAMTVHKSQGSEFAHVMLALPEDAGPGLTRELLYTGLTRARERFTLVCPGGLAVWDQALRRRVLRASGLLATD